MAGRQAALPAAAPTPRFREKRETLLAAAAGLFNAQGVKGATLAEIGASVGLVTTSITYYYRRKEDLATACLLRAIEAHAALADEAAAAPDVAARVAGLLALQADRLAGMAAGRLPPLMLFNDIRALPEAQAATVFAAYNGLFRRVRALLAGPETAKLTRDALNARTHLLLSVFNAMGSWVGRHETDAYPGVARRVADSLLHGLAGAAQTWPAPAALAALGLAEPPPAPDGTADAFLRAATELVNEQGYRGASVEKISARLHLTKGAFYHHHDTKLDLITACFERSFGVLRHVLRAADQAGGPAWPRSCAATAMLVGFQLSDRGPLLRSTATSALPDRAQRDLVRQTHQRLAERIAGLLVDGLVDGSVRALDTGQAALVLAAVINAAAELRRWVPGITEDAAVRLYARPALLGLLCEA